MRIFLAVFPPLAVREAAHAAAEPLRRASDPVSWVKPENLHYTLRFIGEVGESGARRIGEAARAVAARHVAFDAVLGEIGAFPSARRARVIWIGLAQGGPALETLARDLESELRERGFERADHPFKAHLTLGRVRVLGGDWTERLATVAAPPAAGFHVHRIAVVESKLSPRGSSYTVREEGVL